MSREIGKRERDKHEKGSEWEEERKKIKRGRDSERKEIEESEIELKGERKGKERQKY